MTGALCAVFSPSVFAQIAPALGYTANFAVLAHETVFNTDPTVTKGNVGVSPGSAITGFPPATIINGSKYSGTTSLEGAAKISTIAAYLDVQDQVSPTANALAGLILGQTAAAITLKPGVYKLPSSALLDIFYHLT